MVHARIAWQRYWIVGIATCAWALAAQAQAPASPPLPYVSRHWTASTGLPVNAITGLAQTPDGYLWIGTWDGLVRFDGVHFEVFTAANTDALVSSRIRLLQTDRADNLWIVTEQLELVRYRDGRFTRFDAHNGLPYQVTGPHVHVVRPFFETGDGTFWIGTYGGVSRYRDGTMRPFLPDRITEPVTGIAGHPDRDLWFATGVGVLHRVRPDGSVRTYTEADGLTGRYLYGVTEDGAGTVWVGGEGGLHRLEGDRFVPATVDGRVVSAEIMNVYTDPGGQPWFYDDGPVALTVRDGQLRYMAHPDGVPDPPFSRPASPWNGNFDWGFYRDTEDQAYHITHEGRVVFRLPPQVFVDSIWEDDAGNVWLGTDDGLYYLKPASFTVWTRPAPAANGVVSTNVYPIIQDRHGAVWLGTLDADVLCIAGEKVDVMSTVSDELMAGSPLALYEDRSGRIWVGGYNLCQLQVPCPPAPGMLPFPDLGQIRVIYEDTKRRLWVGGENEMARREGGTWRLFRPRDGSLPHRWVRAIHETGDGTLWFGTNGGGLFRLRGDDAAGFEVFNRANGFCSDLVRAFYEDADGYLWVATEDRGLCRIANPSAADVADIDVASIGEREGLFQSGVHVVLEDDYGRFWMSTNRGIFRVPRADLNAVADGRAPRVFPVVYDEADGLLDREANGGVQPAALKDRQGRLWFATQDGAAMIDPAGLRSTVPTRKLLIEAARSGGQPLGVAGGVQLGPDQRDLTITYTVPYFANPEALRFQYRLAGQDEAWFDAATEREARFTNLGSGDFTFQVRALDGQGQWHDQATLAIHRRPYFHETLWFVLLLGTVVALVLLAGVRYRFRQIQERNRLLEQRVADRTRELAMALTTVAEQTEELKSLDATKSRFFSNVSHEFRTPLTLILGPLRSLLDGQYGAVPEAVTAQLHLMLRNSRRLLRLVNQILDLAQFESGTVKLRAREQDLVPFVARIVEAFQPLAQEHGLRLTFTHPATPCPLHVDPQHFEVVLLNLLSNAFKFTPAGGEVHVRLAEETDAVVLTVADTGRGIAPVALARVFDRFYQEEGSQGTGIGLALVRECVELHGGRITATSTVGQGTTFAVYLPKDTAHLDPSQLAAPASVKTAAGGGPYADAGTLSDSMSELMPAWRMRQAASPSENGDGDDVPTILVVDDNPDVRAYLRSLLDPDYHVLEAADGEAAVDVVREQLPDLIVSDVMMPRRDGFALSRVLKADPMTAHIPLILLTAKASKASALEGLDTGADDFLTKPFDPDELRVRIRNQIVARQRLRARYEGEATARADDAPGPETLEARARAVIRARLADPSLSVQELAAALHLTYATFNRHLSAETETKPNELIRQVRLEEAAVLLREGAGSVSEVAYGVGFNKLSYFSHCFREHFGVLPSEYAATH